MTDTDNAARFEDRSVTFTETDVLVDAEPVAVSVEISKDAFTLFRRVVAQDTYEVMTDDNDRLSVAQLRVLKVVNDVETIRPRFVEEPTNTGSVTLDFTVGDSELRKLRSLVQDALSRDGHVGFGENAQELFNMVVEIQSTLYANDTGSATVSPDMLSSDTFCTHIKNGHVEVHDNPNDPGGSVVYRSTDTDTVYMDLSEYEDAELDGDTA
jgi:hypothetical protein